MRCGLPIAPYSSELELRAIVDSADVVLVPASCFAIFPTLAATPARLIVDLHQSVPEADRALRAGDFFLCGGEAERDRWLRILVTRHRISRTRYRRNQDLRKLIDVIDAGDRREATRRNHATPEPSRWDRLVDPVRLYCTRTAREPRGAAWAPRSIAGRAFHVLRQSGPRTFVKRSMAHVRRRLALDNVAQRFEKRPSRSRDPGIDPAVHASTLADRLGSVTRIEEFHQLLVEHHVLDTGGRFVHFEVDVSNKCNIRCRMCHFSFPRVFGAKPIYVAPDVFESIARSLLPQAQALMLSLGSEPLMSPYFAQILKIAARYQVPELGFYTNLGRSSARRMARQSMQRGSCDPVCSTPSWWLTTRSGFTSSRTTRRSRRDASSSIFPIFLVCSFQWPSSMASAFSL